MATKTRICAKPRCPKDATHGVYFRPYLGRWSATIRTDVPGKAPICYCRWHATVLAIYRNAALREVSHAHD